jgi:integrase
MPKPKTERINFTKSVLTKLPTPTEGRGVYRDEKTPNLCVRVTPTGNKTFSFFKKINGRPRRITLGRFPEVTVEQARREARRLAGEVAQDIDPSAARRQGRGEVTLGELFKMYLDNHAKPHKRTWQDDQLQFDRYLTGWASRKLSEITKAEVARLHGRIGHKAPVAANRMLALLSAVFNYATGQALAGHNPARGVKRYREKSRDRFLRADELKRFFAALNDERTPELWRDFFSVCLLTGARRSNVAGMRWANIDFDRGVWRVGGEESKSGEPLLIVLADPAVDILRRRRESAPDAELVFPSPRDPAKPVSEPKTAWRDIRRRTGLDDVRIHDLRRTLGSWQAITGSNLSVIGRSLGHRDTATTAVYARLDTEPVRESVNTACRAMLGYSDADRRNRKGKL